jgi:Holliday junction resolvase RusA-like endonuclease
MTHRGKFTSKRAQSYLSSQAAIAWQMRQQMTGDMFSERDRLKVDCLIITPKLQGDAANLYKALEDAAQGIVYPNDCRIDQITITRQRGKAYRAIFSVEAI